MNAPDGFEGFANGESTVRSSRAAAVVSLALIVIALVALLVLPALLQREVQDHREIIQSYADPARTAVTQVQYRLARQTSSLRGFYISGDSSYIRAYREHAAREVEVYEHLEPLARQMGGEVLELFVELRTLSSGWHADLEEELRGTASVGARGIPFESEAYLKTLDVASGLDGAIARETTERRQEMAGTERRARWIQAGLGALALAATLAAAWLSGRVERLASEAERRRQVAEQALAETARAVESKARLIRGVTHDVKNPLGAADGYAELMELGLNGDLTPGQLRVVAGIRRSIRGALEIIEDLLDLSRAEAGNLAVERRSLNLDGLVREMVEEYRGSASASGHTLEISGTPGPVVAIGDRSRVRQVLGNLLANAIKYTPHEGRIEVQVVVEADGPERRDGCWAAVRVSDTGPGIRPEDQERIFDEFQRLSNAAVEGHGLGLTISRRMARLMEGEITVQSRVGEGSTFVLWLPAERESHG